MQSSDLAVLYFFNRTIASPTLDVIMNLLTNVKYWYAIYVLAGIFIIYKYKMRGLRMVLGAIVLVAITDSLGHYILKPWVGRLRPCALLPNGQHVVDWIRLPIGMKWDPSFPSSHALNNFAIATFFVLIYPKKYQSKWMLLVALLISIGRLYEGVHYPSDVVGGALIGIVFGVAGAMVLEWIEERMSGAGPVKEKEVTLTAEDTGAIDMGDKIETKRVWMK